MGWRIAAFHLEMALKLLNRPKPGAADQRFQDLARRPVKPYPFTPWAFVPTEGKTSQGWLNCPFVLGPAILLKLAADEPQIEIPEVDKSWFEFARIYVEAKLFQSGLQVTHPFAVRSDCTHEDLVVTVLADTPQPRWEMWNKRCKQ